MLQRHKSRTKTHPSELHRLNSMADGHLSPCLVLISQVSFKPELSKQKSNAVLTLYGGGQFTARWYIQLCTAFKSHYSEIELPHYSTVIGTILPYLKNNLFVKSSITKFSTSHKGYQFVSGRRSVETEPNPIAYNTVRQNTSAVIIKISDWEKHDISTQSYFKICLEPRRE